MPSKQPVGLVSFLIILTTSVVGLYLFRPWEGVQKTQPRNIQISNNTTVISSGSGQVAQVEDVDLSTASNGLSAAAAIIEMPQGKIKFKFFPNHAPKTVARFIELVSKKFYNGLKFHRVEPGFYCSRGRPKRRWNGRFGNYHPRRILQTYS